MYNCSKVNMRGIEGINKVRDELYTYGFEFSQIGPESYQHNRKNILCYEIVLELVITYTNNLVCVNY